MIVVGHVRIFVYDLKKEEEECNLKSIKKGLKLLYQRGYIRNDVIRGDLGRLMYEIHKKQLFNNQLSQR